MGKAIRGVGDGETVHGGRKSNLWVTKPEGSLPALWGGQLEFVSVMGRAEGNSGVGWHVGKHKIRQA